MKRILMVLALVAIIATGTAFADHPGGWGIGVLSGQGFSGTSSGHYGLSLKAPVLPIYWGINFNAWDKWFRFGVTGDIYFIDNTIIDPILHWYLGLGALFQFYSWSGSGDYSYMAIGARIPIGLSLQIPLGGAPIDALEFFLAWTPGPYFGLGKNGGGLDIYWGGEFGIRIWL